MAAKIFLEKLRDFRQTGPCMLIVGKQKLSGSVLLILE